MRLPGAARVGIFAVCAAILVFGAVHYWVQARTLVPVDIPVTLAPGHIRTGDFKINVEAYFSVQILFPYNTGLACRYADELRTRRLTSIGGQSIASPGEGGNAHDAVTAGPYLGSFTSKPGTYNLDVEVLSETQNRDTCLPRLVIEASPYDFSEWEGIEGASIFFSGASGLLGVVVLFVFATTSMKRRDLEDLRLRIFETDAPVSPPHPQELKHRQTIPLLLIFGLCGTVAGIVVFAATERWYKTRDFVLVNMPVSLAPGHIKTGDFTTTLKAAYDITMETEAAYYPDCAQYPYPVLKTRWVVTRGGRIAAHREHGGSYDEDPAAPIEGMYLNQFDAEPGTYSLDVEILSDAGCLNSLHPRLLVDLNYSDRSDFAELRQELEAGSLFAVGAGLALLFACRFALLTERPRALSLAVVLPAQKPAWGITGLRSRPVTSRRGWSMNPVVNIPTIAVVCSLTWFVWLIPVWVLYSHGQRSSRGLFVSLPRIGVQASAITLGLTAPVIKIGAKGEVFLNYERTTWEKLPADLEHALRGLPAPVTYFDGDADVSFREVARAIDIIHGAGAKPIMITPRSEAEK